MDSNKIKNSVYIFLGSYIENAYFDNIKNRYCKNNISVSNSEYERVVFNGFISQKLDAYFISAPSVGKYPFNCKKPFIKKIRSKNNRVVYCAYNTIFAFISSSKIKAFKSEIKKICKINKDKTINIICCEMHRPYLEGAKYAYKKYGANTMCIVPDMPEDMNWSSNMLYRYFKQKDIRKCHLIAKEYIKCFVFFTEQMKQRFSLGEKKYLVREGVIEKITSFNNEVAEQNPIVCAYVGKVDKRNGIDAIVCSAITYSDIIFSVYGSGDMEAYLKSLNIKNLHYHGFINPDEVNCVLEKANILLSPRYPLGEYVSYSFPSKILKYIALNKPIVTFKLPCFDDKYSKLLIYPKLNTNESFADAIKIAISSVNKDFAPIIKDKLKKLMVEELCNDIVCLLSN